MRILLYGYCYTDIATRILLYGHCYTDIELLYRYCYMDMAIGAVLYRYRYPDFASLRTKGSSPRRRLAESWHVLDNELCETSDALLMALAHAKDDLCTVCDLHNFSSI